MGIRKFLYTEKGKITSGIIVSTLLTTSIMVPVSIFSDRAINNNGENIIQTYGYDSSISSTGSRQDLWMGIDGEDASKANMDSKLSKNKNYHSEKESKDIIDGVIQTNGISYSSMNDVMQYDSQLEPLNISIDHGNTWIRPSDDDYIFAPLNINMKVPKDVADVLRKHLVNNDDFSMMHPSDLPIDYLNFLIDNDLLLKFALSFIFFNYAIFSPMAHSSLNDIYLSIINESEEISDTKIKQWVKLTFDPLEWKLNPNTKWCLINVDGTATEQKAIDEILNSFYQSQIIEKINIGQLLNNGGSYRAWETVQDFKIPGVINNPDENDGIEDGSKEAFIGTQSRGIETNKIAGGVDGAIIDDGTNKGEISYWGYDESIYDDEYSSKNEDDVIYNINDLSRPGMPLSATIATDKIVFFTTWGDGFIDPLTGNKRYVEGVTREGYRTMFESGISLKELADLNQLEFF